MNKRSWLENLPPSAALQYFFSNIIFHAWAPVKRSAYDCYANPHWQFRKYAKFSFNTWFLFTNLDGSSSETHKLAAESQNYTELELVIIVPS